jgi:serine/threonine protein kinase
MTDRLIAARFKPEHLLGRGGMSEVWLAHDLELDRQVAIKLHAAHADPARFEREALAAARLSHPNVAKVFDYGETEGRPYLVLEYLSGGTLEDRLDSKKPLGDQESERIAREVAAGLAHAHSHGVVHRDLKPSNVLFDGEGRAKIADFGIAQALGETTMTGIGTILGTAAYISPEQASGDTVGPASDVYSFGTILFRMLTGSLPFEGDSALDVALKHRSEPAPPVESRRPDAPASLAAVVAAALAKDPDARPSDGASLVAALEGEPPPTPLATSETIELEPRARHRRVVPLVALGLVALAGLTTGLLAFGDGEDTPGTPGPASEQPADTATSPAARPPSPQPMKTGGATTRGATTAEETTAVTTEPAATTEPTTVATTEQAPTTGNP